LLQSRLLEQAGRTCCICMWTKSRQHEGGPLGEQLAIIQSLPSQF
jgi:hypothetical protein